MKHINRFINQNKGLSILSIIATIVILSYYLSYYQVEIIKGINNWYELLVTLSIGVITNLVFYIFQVYLPQNRKEERAFLLMKSNLYNLCDSLWEFFLLTEFCFPNISKGEVDCPNNLIYYKYKSGLKETSGMLARKFDVFSDYKSFVDKCIKNIEWLNKERLLLECPYELITLISEIRKNGFLRNLKNVVECNFQVNMIYGGLGQDYYTFKKLIEELRILVCPDNDCSIMELTPKEIEIVETKFKENCIPNIGTPYVSLSGKQ